MLTYHPAFDANHAAFRILQILRSAPEHEYASDQLAIFSFYLLFPSLLASFRLPRNLVPWRKVFTKMDNHYFFTGDSSTVFRRTRPMFEAGLNQLYSKGLIDQDRFRTHFVKPSSRRAPETLEVHIEAHNQKLSNVLVFISHLAEMPLNGADGLKDRSNLMEYRYAPS